MCETSQFIHHTSCFLPSLTLRQGPFAESVRDDFNDERLEYVDDICEEVYVIVLQLRMLLPIPGVTVTPLQVPAD